MTVDEQDEFYSQLAKAIQAWGGVETEMYLLYALLMKGANSHLVSVTFHHIESFEAKTQLLDSCLRLLFSRDSDEYKSGKALLNESKKLNKIRNKIVHEPVIIRVRNGVESIAISPSYFNSLALTKGQTTYHGPVIVSTYRPSIAKITDEHKIDIRKLIVIRQQFKDCTLKIRDYKNKILPLLNTAYPSRKATKKQKGTSHEKD
jgi:PHD/YefM family antitoxin component YafN of YafNO toxin-antitoxin module